MGRDLAGDGGAGRAGQDLVRRLVQLRGLAYRAGQRHRGRPRVLRPGQRAVHLQPADQGDRAGGAARGDRVRRRRHPVVPAGRRAARRRAPQGAFRWCAPPGRPGPGDARAAPRADRALRGPVRRTRRGAGQRGAGLAAAPGGCHRADHRTAYPRPARRRAARGDPGTRRRRAQAARRPVPRLPSRPGALRLVSLVSATPQTPRLLRDRSGVQRVTNIELFFDLVYVFAITQLSHFLLAHSDLRGALQAGLLLVMIWLVWVYTTWVTNWLDPDQMAVRLLLVVLMLVSLSMSAALPRAFEDLGLWIGGGYALQQVGRSVFMVIALRGHALQANFERILAWCVVSGALAVGGGFAHGSARYLLWLLAVGVDLAGGVVGFATPGLGRSRTSDWTIEGGHFAERCQGFILIALGESIVIIGATLTDKPVRAASVTAFVVAFASSVAL